MSHVLWTTGVVLDVHALKERTGLPVLVDGAQSVGAIPVEVGALDYYTVSGQKWLCGPESTGALYVADVGGAPRGAAGVLGAGVVRARRTLRPARGRAAVRPRLDLRRVAQRARDGARPRSGLALRPDPRAAARCREALAEHVPVVTPPGQAGW